MSKTNGNEPIFPCEANADVLGGVLAVKQMGLTKRELFAAMAMQGIWANPHDIPGKTDGEPVGTAIARVAVNQADALIEALNKKGSKTNE